MIIIRSFTHQFQLSFQAALSTYHLVVHWAVRGRHQVGFGGITEVRSDTTALYEAQGMQWDCVLCNHSFGTVDSYRYSCPHSAHRCGTANIPQTLLDIVLLCDQFSCIGGILHHLFLFWTSCHSHFCYSDYWIKIKKIIYSNNNNNNGFIYI